MTDTLQPPSSDLRKALRTPLIVLRVKLDDEGKAFFGYARNISRSGLFIPATSPRETGSRFLIEFDLPTPIDRSIRCTCEVVWNRQFSRKSLQDPGMGLRFIDLPEDLADAIDAWVKHQDQAP